MGDDKEPKTKFTYEELREKYLEKKPKTNKRLENYHQIASDYSMVMSFVITILVFVSLGVFLGYKLDLLLKTVPLFTLLFTFLGIGAAFRNLYKDATREKKGRSKNE